MGVCPRACTHIEEKKEGGREGGEYEATECGKGCSHPLTGGSWGVGLSVNVVPFLLLGSTHICGIMTALATRNFSRCREGNSPGVGACPPVISHFLR